MDHIGEIKTSNHQSIHFEISSKMFPYVCWSTEDICSLILKLELTVKEHVNMFCNLLIIAVEVGFFQGSKIIFKLNFEDKKSSRTATNGSCG